MTYSEANLKAKELAGDPEHIDQRIKALLEIYKDSNRQHQFPLIAAHGALWAKFWFSRNNFLINWLVNIRYFYSSKQRTEKKNDYYAFARDFQAINRQVFIDTYTYYYSDEKQLSNPKLSELITKVNNGNLLDENQKTELFTLALKYEQENLVGQKVFQAWKKFDCDILKFIGKKPIVRFSYFPKWRYLFFSDFTNIKERTGKAIIAYNISMEVGFDLVEKKLEQSLLNKN